ncbi:MAG: DUF2090 domain-containing protein, partial [Gammaproteobacteria bacterium]|nr:DUF2090 domain-containing protein [Gammaproteobacteria bacterium]
FETEGELVEQLASWPLTQTVKVLCPYRLDDTEQVRQHHDDLIIRLDHACRFTGHEWLLEIITARAGQPPQFDSVARIVQHFYQLKVKPDWWKLEPGMDADYWQQLGDLIDVFDPNCQGLIVLGLDGSMEAITKSFEAAVKQPYVKGFAVGRTLFSQAAQDWLAGRIDDATAVVTMRGNYRRLIDAWDTAKAANL